MALSESTCWGARTQRDYREWDSQICEHRTEANR
jgi:hypothetical protein